MINIEVIKCYKKLFCKEGILHNIGSYILLTIIFIFIVGFIIFVNKEFISLQKKIELFIISDINNVNNIKDINNINNENVNNSNLNNKKIVRKKGKKSKRKKIKKKEKIGNDSTIPSKEQMLQYLNNKDQKLDINDNKTKNKRINFTNIATENIDNNYNKKEKVEVNDNEKKVMSPYELNESEYKDAIKYDKRSYLDYYCSLIKLNHLLLFAVIPQKDYNSKIIKFCLFLYSFALNLTIETLFYDEETMNNIYEIRGVYDIISQIPEIIYTSIISSVIDFIIKYFSLSLKYVIEQKNKKINENNELKYKRIINNLYKKFIFFFILSILLLLFCWYYISCFCAVYKNTQIHLIKDVLIGFTLSLVYPFISYSLSGIFRILALRYEKECIFKFSNLIVI